MLSILAALLFECTACGGAGGATAFPPVQSGLVGTSGIVGGATASPLTPCATETASQSLTQIAAQVVWANNPAQDVAPRNTTVALADGRPARPAVQMISQSRSSYNLPPNVEGFSTIVAYDGSSALQTPHAAVPDNAIRLRILADDNLIYQDVFSDSTPARAINLNVSGVHVLTFATESHWGFDSLYLLDPALGTAPCTSSAGYVLRGNTGYVAFATPQEALFGALPAGSTLPLEVAFGAVAQAADLRLTLRAEQGQFPPYTFAATIPLTRSDSALSSGKLEWQVPPGKGPAQLTIEEFVNGVSAFRQTRRVAIVPAAANVAGDSVFGLHTSTAGFSFLQDKAVSLWGAAWDRCYIAWNIVEPVPGTFDYSRIDEVVSGLRDRNVRVLGVLGENSPAWAGNPGADYYAAWKNYVATTVRHFRGSIDHWDVFNEIDDKYYGSLQSIDPNADLTLLKSAIDTIRATCPECKIVCCSTGSSNWLSYDRRILPDLLAGIDFVSWHPYRYSPPEQKEGFYDYLGELAALRALQGQYGLPKPVWGTEANWIIGPYSASNVRNPEMDEHTQAQYVARINLLAFSQQVPYFLHAPFYHYTRRQVQLDTLAAYAHMTSMFGAASSPRLWAEGGAYAVAGQRSDGTIVGALWSTGPGAAVAIGGVAQPVFTDMYGNAAAVDIRNLKLDQSPLYFTAAPGSSPQFELLTAVAPRVWTSLPEWPAWSRNATSQYDPQLDGSLRVQQQSQYQYQLVSPAAAVIPGACYTLRFRLKVDSGSISVFAVDTASGQRASMPIYVSDEADASLRDAEFRAAIATATSVQFVISNGNPNDALTDFTIAGTPQLASCR